MSEFEILKQKLAAISNAAEIFAREHAKATNVADADLLKVARLYPTYDEFVKSGKKIMAADVPVLRHNGILYKVAVDSMPDPKMTPDKVATNFVRINDPDAEEYTPWEKGSWAKGAKVMHDGRYWVSDIDSNTREPGTPDSNWTEVKPPAGKP